MDDLQSPFRRRLLLAGLFPGLQRWFEPLEPKQDSYTAWFEAARVDDVKLCKDLLARGFDSNTIEPERLDTALLIAVRQGSVKVTQVLLSTPGVNLDARSRNGDTSLMLAAFKKDLAVARALIEKGAEINRPGWTALHYAATVGSLPIVRLLLDHDAYIDAESPNKTTPLMMAARGGHRDVIDYLISQGADLDAKNELGLTAVDFARAQAHPAIANFLETRMRESKTKSPSRD
jgi:ankyrin repeat protein